MANDTADTLRDMALHRGLKLVRSRRRKPGTGDFGKFGLTDETGTELLGFGRDGLTASADEIEAYLREGATSTWQQSAKITPNARPAQRLKSATSEPDSPARVKAARSQRAPTRPSASDRPSRTADVEARSPGSDGPTPPKQTLKVVASPPPPKIVPEPELVLRLAKPADAGKIAELLSLLAGVTVSEGEAANALTALRKVGGGVHVAVLGDLVGCIGWAVVPTLQHGLIGRITALVVAERRRRRGIGGRLLTLAEGALDKQGCTMVEAMSDIDIKNAHGFFRSARFEQKSYRFVRAIESS